MVLFERLRESWKFSKAIQLLTEYISIYQLPVSDPEFSKKLVLSLIQRYPKFAFYKASPEIMISAAIAGGIRYFDENQNKMLSDELFTILQNFLTLCVFKKFDTTDLSPEDRVLYNDAMSIFEDVPVRKFPPLSEN